ncbi:hypothetical protein EPN83_03415 [Patescibacteria group bacterium]|nr:MAG: hypothetical protein EPN83_03415 [Patescibacteria group bacterium]
MKDAASFFKIIQSRLFPQECVRDALLSLLEKRFHTSLKKNTLSFAEHVVYLKVSPTLRSEIMLHKEELLAAVGECCGERKLLDIR